MVHSAQSSTSLQNCFSVCKANEEGRRLEEAPRVSEAVAKYEQAAKLYRGGYLIEDL